MLARLPPFAFCPLIRRAPRLGHEGPDLPLVFHAVALQATRCVNPHGPHTLDRQAHIVGAQSAREEEGELPRCLRRQIPVGLAPAAAVKPRGMTIEQDEQRGQPLLPPGYLFRHPFEIGWCRQAYHLDGRQIQPKEILPGLVAADLNAAKAAATSHAVHFRHRFVDEYSHPPLSRQAALCQNAHQSCGLIFGDPPGTGSKDEAQVIRACLIGGQRRTGGRKAADLDNHLPQSSRNTGSPVYPYLLMAFPLRVFAAYLGLCLAWVVGATLAFQASGLGHSRIYEQPFDHWFWNIFAQGDGASFVALARGGPGAAPPVFFPLYPLLLRLAMSLSPIPALGALLATWAVTAIALVSFYILARAAVSEGSARRALLAFVAFPAGYFLVILYSESLFLALTMAAFLLMRRGRWFAAGTLGYLSALTRLTGSAMAVPLAWETCRRWRAGQRPSVSWLVAVLPPLGFVTYGTILALTLDHPLAALSAEEGWGRHVSFPIVATILHSASVILEPRHPLAAAYELYRVGYLVLGLWLLVGLFRRRWHEYGLWAAATLLLPLSSGNLVSIHRFVWAIFPFFFLVGDWGETHPRLFAGGIVAMAVLQAAVLAAFVNAPALPFPLLS